MPAARAQSLLHSDLAGALRHRDKHDVHEADSADPQGEGADESEQNLQTDSEDFKKVHLFHQTDDHYGAPIPRIEPVLVRQDVAHGLLDPSIVGVLIAKPDVVEVVRVFQVAHRGEGDVNDAIDIVVPLLHFGREDAAEFKGDAVDSNAFAEGVTSGKQLFPGLGTDDGDASALDLILGVIEASLGESKSRR